MDPKCTPAQKRRIAVGILCGRGETDEALQVIQRINLDVSVETILPLFPYAPCKCKGKYVFFPPAADNRRGAARTALVQVLAKMVGIDYGVILDDDTLPSPGYFEYLRRLEPTNIPRMFSGKLENADGTRSWDLCSIQAGNPVVIPYEFLNNPLWADDLYFSGPQHIFNAAGLRLAARTGYPDVTYGEDTNFCRAFKKAGGQLHFLSMISAKLLHQHTPPNEVMPVHCYRPTYGWPRQ